MLSINFVADVSNPAHTGENRIEFLRATGCLPNKGDVPGE